MFDKDLFEWTELEREFVKKMLRPWIAKVEFGYKSPDRDVRLTDEEWHTKTYEIKKNSSDTHVAFEYMYDNKPSWVLNSKADYIVYYYKGKFHRQTRWKFLERFIDLHKWKTSWWDNNKAELYVMESAVADMLREWTL